MSTKQSACSNCNALFESRGLRDAHSRKCNPPSTISFPEGVITIPRSEDGKYMCYCTHPKCPQPFERMDALIRHVKRAGSRWRGPQPTMSSNETQINSDEGGKDNEVGDDIRQESHSNVEAGSTSRSHTSNLASVQKIQYRESVQLDSDDIDLQTYLEEDNLLLQSSMTPTLESEQEEYATSPPASSDQDEHESYFSEEENIIVPIGNGDEAGDHQHNLATGPLDEQLKQIPYLQSLGIAINTSLHCFCCTVCQVALVPDGVSSHLSHSHGYKKSLVDKNQLKAIAEVEDVMDSLPEIAASEALDPFEGLKILEGLQCSLCHAVSGSQESMRKHHSHSHPGQAVPKSWKPCCIQRLTTYGKGATFFKVKGPPSPPPTSEEKIIENIQKDLANIIAVNITPENTRSISPWLLSTRWHEHVQPYDVTELLKLIKIPSDDELPGLKDLVTTYMENAVSLIKHTTELTLQKLNTADPQKGGINNMPFHEHQQNGTLKTYITAPYQLLSFLIRPKLNYQIPLPKEVEQRLQVLSDSLTLVSLEYKLEALHNAFMGLWKRKWAPTPDNTLPCPTTRALALMTMRPSGGFVEPKDATGFISRFEYCIRLAMLYEIKRIAGPQYNGDEGLACDQVQRWFTEKVDSPFNSLRSLQHRASSLAFQTMSLPRIWWTDHVNWTSMLYKGNPLHIDQVRSLFVKLKDMVIKQWEEKVLCGMDIQVEYSAIADDLTCNDVGYSFLVDPRNKAFKQRDSFLRAILKNPKIRAHFLEINMATGSYIWNKNSLHKWLQDYAFFHALQLIRTKMLGGSPGRVTELAAMNYCSTELRSVRNLFALGKYVAVMRTYTKTSALSHVDKLIPHALDGVTSDLMVQDLAIARPFAEIAVHVCYPQDAHIHKIYKERLFINNLKEFDTTVISRIMVDVSMPIVGFELSVNPWRHISIAWRNKLCPELSELWEDGDEAESIGALQTGHRRKTEIRIYGLSPDALAGPAEDILPLYLECSTGWQVEMHVAPGGQMVNYLKVTLSPVKNSREQSGQVTSLKDLLVAMEDRMVAKVMKALGGELQNRIVEGVMDRIHPHLKALGSPQPQMANIKTSSLALPIGPPLIASSDSGKLEVSCLGAMRKLLHKPDAGWTCPEQWNSLEEVLRLRMDVLAIMRTGSGKSMLIILPTILEQDQVTVAILPFTSLIMDYSRKLQQLAVPYEVYKSQSKLHGHVNLILVSADLAKTSRWKQEITQLNERRPVVRMVFDEGHLAFTATSYRKSLQDLHDLRRFPCQIVVLSGTIPPQSQPLVIKSFGLSNPFVVRTSSNRPEIQYILEDPVSNSGAIVMRVKEIVASFFLTEEDRYLIFVPYIEEGQKISKTLGIGFYYSGKQDEIPSTELRQKYYDDWFLGKTKGMVCTSAFGAGNDYSHVRLVIHAGTPKEMIGYTQESGRSGRDGRPSSCFILPKKDTGKTIDDEEDDHQGRQAISSMLYQNTPTDCIRFHITSFCDPIGIYCRDDPTNQLCSGCSNAKSLQSSINNKEHQYQEESAPPLKRRLNSAFGEAYEESKAKRIERHQVAGQYVDAFLQALTFYIGNCPYCLALGCRRRETVHALANCPALKLNMDFYQALQQDLEYKDYHPPICWKCHVPQCHDTLHPEFVISKKACEFKDIIVPVVTAAFVVKRKEACREFGKKWHDVVQAAQWFNEKPIKGHQSNLTALFLWYYYEHQVQS